ncbi:MAG: hypothetical protein KA717_11880 [Woronichinia naegeliana WA131]|uniref:Uncharacterized protein n=1 Tax=Woronichinia naegeliana WA131 TaxID=2824559 RepID=A0A977PV14_9CYAN|nr:MAG: hypothetical protein KA717_28535 [Woronichinia naegeliana WA131]UXE63277.1 MAG: hypothetical protein KA717_11880 [Woronichinia naegeliana WA131]
MDAYFACEPVLKSFRQNALHLITRVRCSTVAYAPFCSVPTLTGRGRPRIWGSSIKDKTRKAVRSGGGLSDS